MNQPCTTPFNAGKLFGGPVLFSDPTIDGLFGNPRQSASSSVVILLRNFFILFVVANP
jgi:hypothetical protein